MLQYNASTGPVLWRKFLGFTRDRILAQESRRRTGTASSSRYPRTWATLTPPALRSGFHKRRTDLSLRRCGARVHSISTARPTLQQICATPGGATSFGGSATPIALSPADRTRANQVYDHWAQSLNAYEHSEMVSPFTSKFDAYLKGNYTLTADEMAGYKLFRGKGNCNSCHLDGRSTAPLPSAPDSEDTGTTANVTPLFTCFGSANEGLPKIPGIAVLLRGHAGFLRFHGQSGRLCLHRLRDWVLFLRSGFGSAPNPNSTWSKFASSVDGQMQVSTARNAALAPPQCPTTEAPGPYFQKEFFHNGYIKSLKQLVHFYNTRDVYRFAVDVRTLPCGYSRKSDLLAGTRSAAKPGHDDG